MIFFFFSDPSFVSSLEYKDYIFFFFREIAVEYINCGKVNTYIYLIIRIFFSSFVECYRWKQLRIYSKRFNLKVWFFFLLCLQSIFSRVARVCKHDKGGPHSYSDRWTSFLKARLNCSIPGEYPFYFDEIRKYLHRIFFTPTSWEHLKISYILKNAMLVYFLLLIVFF